MWAVRAQTSATDQQASLRALRESCRNPSWVSGVPCVYVRADEPGGGALLQHCSTIGATVPKTEAPLHPSSPSGVNHCYPAAFNQLYHASVSILARVSYTPLCRMPVSQLSVIMLPYLLWL